MSDARKAHVSNAGTNRRHGDPADEAPAGNPRFSDFVDSQASGSDDSDEPTDPSLRFADWAEDGHMDTTYHEHVGPVSNTRGRSRSAT